MPKIELYQSKGISLQGIVVKVPSNIVYTVDEPLFGSPNEAEKFKKLTQIEKRHIASDNQTTLDLCLESGKNLIEELNWDIVEIDVLIFVSQTGDYLTPNNAIIAQSKLGLRNNIIAFDLTLGCSGFPYVWFLVSNLLNHKPKGKALVLIGDTLSKQASPYDKTTYPLFGDAGAAVAFANTLGDSIAEFLFNSNGSKHEAIIVKGGMYRNPINGINVDYQVHADGIKRKLNHTFMDGATVYEFTLFEVFDQIVQLIEDCSIIENQNDIDYFVLHQANGYVIDSLARKLQIDPSRNLRSIKEFGNTSSASIPLSIVNNLINIESGKILLMSGFGVGLSWASMIYKNDFEVRVMKII